MIAGGLYAGVPWADMEAAGLAIDGDRALLARLATFFPMPVKAAAG